MTIFALSSGPGVSGVAIIRISGFETQNVIKTLTGREKKNMIISMLNHIVDITDGPGDDDILDPVVKRVIPSVIDLVLVVDNGKLKKIF